MAMTLVIAIVVMLAICWPRRAATGPKKSRWTVAGALAGVLPGLAIAALMLANPGQTSNTGLVLTASVVCSTTIAGILLSRWLFRLRTGVGSRFRISLRTFLLLPVVLVPLFVALLPVLPYQGSCSTTSPFSFVVVDEMTGQPIANASVRLIDPRFSQDDLENQGPRVVTGADGSVEYFLFANIQGRQGLLWKTETISYNPWTIRVEALGYRPFVTSLAGNPTMSTDQFTAVPLGMIFPPPPSVTIRLSTNSVRSD
jgi:hypothetical protein